MHIKSEMLWSIKGFCYSEKQNKVIISIFNTFLEITGEHKIMLALKNGSQQQKWGGGSLSFSIIGKKINVQFFHWSAVKPEKDDMIFNGSFQLSQDWVCFQWIHEGSSNDIFNYVFISQYLHNVLYCSQQKDYAFDWPDETSLDPSMEAPKGLE